MMMNTKIKKQVTLALGWLLVTGLAMPAVAHTGKSHSHHKHYEQSRRHFNQHKHKHKHKHNKHSHRYVNKHVPAYRQPSVYYQQYYPQPQYNYYSPAPVYVVPPQVNMGVRAGDMDFRLRF
jgi:hypothetical protein